MFRRHLPISVGMRILAAFIIALLGMASIRAGDIEGKVIIQHRLTKRKVTLAAGAYDRGATVELGSEPGGDPLDLERTRVVIYLDGALPSQPASAALEQKNRRFVQDTLIVPAGSTVS